jgi:hypothetical protein
MGIEIDHALSVMLYGRRFNLCLKTKVSLLRDIHRIHAEYFRDYYSKNMAVQMLQKLHSNFRTKCKLKTSELLCAIFGTFKQLYGKMILRSLWLLWPPLVLSLNLL